MTAKMNNFYYLKLTCVIAKHTTLGKTFNEEIRVIILRSH